jgi:hypothetical protein
MNGAPSHQAGEQQARKRVTLVDSHSQSATGGGGETPPPSKKARLNKTKEESDEEEEQNPEDVKLDVSSCSFVLSL